MGMIQESRTERGLSSPQQLWNILRLRKTLRRPFFSRCCGLESPRSVRLALLESRALYCLPFAILALGSLLLAGCQNPGPRFNPHAPAGAMAMQSVAVTNQINSEWLKPPTNFLTLGPGDKLEIELLSDPASKTTTTVGPDGKIYFNLLSGLDVWGLTLGQTKALLEKELAKFIRDQVQVSLTLRAVESQRVWLLGRLQSPGVYPMAAPMTLLEAISLAGGPLSVVGTRDVNVLPSSEETADLRRSFVIRQGKLVRVDFDRLLRQGDLTRPESLSLPEAV